MIPRFVCMLCFSVGSEFVFTTKQTIFSSGVNYLFLSFNQNHLIDLIRKCQDMVKVGGEVGGGGGGGGVPLHT